jgi:hypothetical protein
MANIEQTVLSSLESSGQFTPEQRAAIAQAVFAGINEFLVDIREISQKRLHELGMSDKELKARLP